MPAAVARARSEEKRRIACPRPRSTHRKPSSQPSSRCDSSRFSAASNASDALGKRKSLRGKLSGDVRLEDVSLAVKNQVEVEPGASRDPTLEFDLTAEEKKVEEEATPLLLSRNASAKASTRALELKVEEMEGKLEETLAAVRRVETLMQDLAKT